jgi:transcriptional regulator with XRE-family HTH domain
MLGEALRLIRVFHDLNKSQVAERVGLSKSYVTELERGDKKVTLEVLEKYASAFNIPVSSLMLFAERVAQGGIAESARVRVAGKVLKMLGWLAAITEDEDADESEKTAKTGAS